MSWPTTRGELEQVQHELAKRRFVPWTPSRPELVVAGVFVCFPSGARGEAGEPAWAAAVATRGRTLVGSHVLTGTAGAPYVPGLLALREGALLEAAVRGLDVSFDCLLVNASGRDHPRRAGLALELGAVIGCPTIGVTDRPLLGAGEQPAAAVGSTSPVVLDDEVVAARVRTREGARPIVVHSAYRTDLTTAVSVVLACSQGTRTPEPLRQARRLARSRRTGVAG